MVLGHTTVFSIKNHYSHNAIYLDYISIYHATVPIIEQGGLCYYTHFFHLSLFDVVIKVLIEEGSVTSNYDTFECSSPSRIRYMMMMILLCSCN